MDDPDQEKLGSMDRLRREKERVEIQLEEATRTSQRTKKVLDALMADATSFYMSSRVRPFSELELARRSHNVLMVDQSSNTITLTEVRNDNALRVQFDEVFDSSDPSGPNFASQQHVYDRVGKPLLDFAFQGFNVTLLGFGQTSSGKTYTLVGDNVDRGIVPRFIADLFEFFRSREKANPHELWKVEMDAIEVYNEKIYNLLEGCVTEDGLCDPVPQALRPTMTRPSRFNRGTFADIEKEQKGRARGRTPNGLQQNGTPYRLRSPTPSRNRSNTPQSVSMVDTASQSSVSLTSSHRSSSPLTSYARSPRGSTTSMSSLRPRSGDGSSTPRSYVSNTSSSRDVGAPENDRYQIKGGVLVPYYIKGLQPILVTNVNKVFNLLAITQQNKTIAETRMNRASSRSHTLYRWYLTRTEGQRTVRSCVCLVDLAGSENIKQSNAQGINQSEAISINKSLTVLAHCLSLRATGSKISPPYKECTLTKLLKETLEGNARTHMVITLSPSDCNAPATTAALRFAKMCKKVRTKPRCNLEGEIPYAEQIQHSIEDLKRQLEKEEGRNQSLKDKLLELEEFMEEEKRRNEIQKGGQSTMALKKFLTDQERILIHIERTYFAEELKMLTKGDKRLAQNYYLQQANDLRTKGQEYSYTLEELDPDSEDDVHIYRSLSDVFQWSCTQHAAAEFLLYRLQLTVTKIEKVINHRLRSDFFACKASLKGPHSPSVLRFYGSKIDNMEKTLRYGFELPDPKKFNTYGVGLNFSTNATKTALSTSETTNQLLVCETALGNIMPPSSAAQIGLHLLSPDLVHRKGFDSVHATCGTTMLDDEYIVFQSWQAIPAFLVTYTIEQPEKESTLRVKELESTNSSLEAKIKALERELEKSKEQIKKLEQSEKQSIPQPPPVVLPQPSLPPSLPPTVPVKHHVTVATQCTETSTTHGLSDPLDGSESIGTDSGGTGTEISSPKVREMATDAGEYSVIRETPRPTMCTQATDTDWGDIKRKKKKSKNECILM